MTQKNKGVCCILLSSFSFALMNMFVRMSGDLPSIQKSFFRNFVAMLFALSILMKERPEIRLDGTSKKYLFLRSLCGTIGILCNFYAVDHLVLADASMLNKMSPFFAILFGILILKEKINLFQGLCVVTAFTGTLFVIKPTPSNLACFPALIGLLGGLTAGMAYTYVRALGTRGVKGPFIVFFFSAFSCLSETNGRTDAAIIRTVERTSLQVIASLNHIIPNIDGKRIPPAIETMVTTETETFENASICAERFMHITRA